MTQDTDTIMADAELDPAQLATPLAADAQPKRGPGRPKGSRNASTSGTRARSGKPSVRQACVAIVQAVNLSLVLGRRWVPQIREDDVLTDGESTLLVQALEAEASQSVRIARWAERAGGISAHAVLIQAAVMIATPRLQRRGILPSIDTADLTPEQRAAFDAYNATDPNAPIRMETGRAPVSNGAYGFGQDDTR